MATQATIRPGRSSTGSGSGIIVPINFSQTNGSQVTITAAGAKPATVVSVTITTQGNPVQIIVSGDANPSAAGWGRLNLYRDVTAIGQEVQFESSAANENVPYSLHVIDQPIAGTWTYSLKVTSVTTDTQFGEAAGPIITAMELGGVGSATPSGTAGGDLGGTYPNPDVVAIQGYSVSSAAPGAGEALIWDGSNWAPTPVSAGAGGNDTNIQYNSGGSLTGTNNFIFDDVSTRVTLTDGAQALDLYSNLIEYVGPGSLQIEASTTVDIATLTATGINLGAAGVATTFAGTFTFPTVDGASGEVLTTDGLGNVSWQTGGGGNFVPISTSDYIIAIPGDNISTKYGLAKLLTPGGNPLSATNRAALIILPGNYVLSGTFTLDTEFIDVIGLGGVTKKPAVHISGSNIQADADDIRVTNLDMGNNAIFVGNSLTNQVFQNCIGGNGMFQATNEVAGTFIDCVGGDDSFTGASTVASGRFIRCDAGGGAIGCFGFDASGYFEDCTSTGDYAFGGFANSYGTFIRCTASGSTTFGALGIASGIYIDCKTTGTDSFGSGGVANGTFTRCTATGAGSFGGGNSGLALPNGCRGVFDHCVGGLSSFGDSAEGYAPATRGISGQLYFCRATVGTFYNFRILTAVCTPGTPASFDVSPDDHNYSVGTPVRFSTTGIMPAGALASKTYFVASTPTNSTFTLETYQGSGIGIDTTDAGTGNLTVTSGRLVHCVDGYHEPFTV